MGATSKYTTMKRILAQPLCRLDLTGGDPSGFWRGPGVCWRVWPLPPASCACPFVLYADSAHLLASFSTFPSQRSFHIPVVGVRVHQAYGQRLYPRVDLDKCHFPSMA